MKKFSFLTSVAVFGVMSASAFADIASDASGATCNSDTIGVSSGSTILEALWTAQSKNCDAGQYLNASTANCTTCPTGSYCAGGTYTYNGSNLGITNACPTNYNSDEGASAQTDCYRACTTEDVAHSTAVSGRYYYGDNNQCGATSCATGYSTQSFLSANFVSDFENASRTLYTYATMNNEGFQTSGNGTSYGQDYYGISSGEYAVDFVGFGTIRGTYRCVTEEFDIYDNIRPDSIPEEEGRNCWCNITGFKQEGTSNWLQASSTWYFSGRGGDGCDQGCSLFCAQLVNNESFDWIELWLRTVDGGPMICNANTYNCGWGQYLDVTECKSCPAGSYCDGRPWTTFTYDGTVQGLHPCPNGYTSKPNSGDSSSCYSSGTAICSERNPYNGLNSDKVTSVVYGNSNNGTASCKTYYGSDTCTLDQSGACNITSFTCASGWTANIGLNLNDEFAAATPTNSSFAFVRNNYGNEDYEEINNNGSKTQAYYGITEVNEWATDFDGWATIRGIASCNSTSGTWATATDSVTSANFGTTTEGANCWCKLTGYRMSGDLEWNTAGNAWVFRSDGSGGGNANSDCAYNCASECASSVQTSNETRTALLNTAVIPASCSANTITIDWYNLGTLLQTNSCTYGQSDIVIPETPSRTGYDFGGWKVNNAQ